MRTTLQKICIVFFLFPFVSCAQLDLNKINKAIKDNTNLSKPLSNDEIVRGLKEALTIGSNNSASAASKVDGYFKNSIIKIPFPPEAREMEQKLRSIGMSKQVDDFVLTLNRAAEEAAKEAGPVFVNSVKQMTITDGVKILKGKDDEATQYLKRTTSVELKGKFQPIVKRAIDKVQVTSYWNPLASAYNRIPFVTKVNPNLENYVTEKALDGLFYLVAQEELKIRKDPMARVTDLLKKVFGNKN
jgi:RNA binding exosome subunit